MDCLMCDADLMATQPEPFRLDAYRDYAQGYRQSGLHEAARFIDRIVAEVERLDALLSELGGHSDAISDSIVHYREHRL